MRFMNRSLTSLSAAGLVVVLSLLQGASAEAEPTLRRCQVRDGQKLFAADAQSALKVLILPFYGAGPVEQNVARQVYSAMQRIAGGLADSVKPAKASCYVDNHEHARAIGLAFGADVVVWGTANRLIDKGQRDPRANVKLEISGPAGAQIGSNNQIHAGAGSRVQAGVIINNPQFRITTGGQLVLGSLRPSLTITRWAGQSGALLREDLLAPKELELPRTSWFDIDMRIYSVMNCLALQKEHDHRGAAECFLEIEGSYLRQGAAVPGDLYELSAMNQLLGLKLKETRLYAEPTVYGRGGIVPPPIDPELSLGDQFALGVNDCSKTDLHCRIRRTLLFAVGFEYLKKNVSATEKLREALELVSAGASRADQIAVYSSLSRLAYNEGRKVFDRDAIDYQLQALALRQQSTDPIDHAIGFNNLGVLLHRTANRLQAFSYFMQAFEILRRTPNLFLQATLSNNLCVAYQLAGDLSQADIACRDATDLLGQLGDPWRQVRGQCALAGLASRQLRHQEAAERRSYAFVLAKETFDFYGASYVDSQDRLIRPGGYTLGLVAGLSNGLMLHLAKPWEQLLPHPVLMDQLGTDSVSGTRRDSDR